MLPLRKVVNKLTRMTGNNILLDTNIISAWLKGESGIADKLDETEGVYIPAIVAGELHYGAQYSTHVERNIQSINRVIARYEVLQVGVATAAVYGTLKAALKKKGKPIPENDIWIAAIATQYSLPLITRDKHFNEIDGLTVITW